MFDRAVKTDRDTTAHASLLSEQRVRPYFPIAFVALIGLSLTLMASTMVWHWETKTATQQFQSAATTQFIVLQNGINDYLSKLRALHALFAATRDEVTRDEFETFSRPVLQYNTAIQTLSWVPRVLRSERAAHELAGAAAGLPDYRIKSRFPDGSMIPSAEHDEYFPVFFVTLPKTSPLYGLDLASNLVVRAELEQARDGNTLGFTEVPVLVSAEGAQHGFVFSLPVYRNAVPGDTIEERRRDLVGFVHGSIITSKLIEIALGRGTPPQGIDTFFFHPDRDPAMHPLYVHKSHLGQSQPGQGAQANSMMELRASHTLVAENQPWLTAIAVPVPDGPLAVHHDRTWLVLGAGLAVTLLVSLHIGDSVRFTQRLLMANEEISALANRDALTGLVNRRSFNERLGRMFAASRKDARPFSILYFDLDHFKDVNDTLGHATGDLLLQKVAARLSKIVRQGDVVARFGGDEFAILQDDSNAVAPAMLATRLLETIARPFALNGNQVHIAASIGIAQSTNQVSTPDALIMQADLALYRAKADGRNCFRFHSSELDREVHDRVVTAEELRKGITRDELQLYYQPQVDLRTGRIIGVEALVRWLHPTRGLLAPSHFIPIAERTGSIIALGSWVFEEACRQTKFWSDLGLSPGVVAVNVSAHQFNGGYDPEKDFAAALEKWRIEPFAIEAELTESVLMEVTQQHSDSLARLKRLGVRIAIDDFGTGYSSLNYLTKFPVSRLKIAQELVFGVANDSRNATVVRAAIHLASELGIECIAEGIDSEKQVDFLIKAGCHHGQGYYFGKPMAAAEMTAFLEERRARLGRPGPRLVA